MFLVRTVQKELLSIRKGASSTGCTCTFPSTNVAHTSTIGTRNNKTCDSAVPLTPQYPDYPTSTLLAALSPGSRQDRRNHVRQSDGKQGEEKTENGMSTVPTQGKIARTCTHFQPSPQNLVRLHQNESFNTERPGLRITRTMCLSIRCERQ